MSDVDFEAGTGILSCPIRKEKEKKYESIQKFPDWVDNEINNNNKHSLRSNTGSYGGKTH
jgi:hypothetical protein